MSRRGWPGASPASRAGHGIESGPIPQGIGPLPSVWHNVDASGGRRHDAGRISQRELGRHLGVPHSRIGRVLRGQPGVLTIDMAARMASVLGLELNVTLHPSGEPVRDKGHLALLERFHEFQRLSRVLLRLGKSRHVLDGTDIGVRSHAYTQVQRGDNKPGHSVRTVMYRYIEWAYGEQGAQLYDMEKDPFQTMNLANDPAYAQPRAELSAKIQEHWPKPSQPTAPQETSKKKKKKNKQ